MKKKTTVVLMALLLALSFTLSGCGRDDAGVDNLNDDLYNDSGNIGEDLDNMGEDIVDDADKIGEDIKDGTEDILDGNDINNHDGIVNDNKENKDMNT